MLACQIHAPEGDRSDGNRHSHRSHYVIFPKPWFPGDPCEYMDIDIKSILIWRRGEGYLSAIFVNTQSQKINYLETHIYLETDSYLKSQKDSEFIQTSIHGHGCMPSMTVHFDKQPPSIQNASLKNHTYPWPLCNTYKNLYWNTYTYIYIYINIYGEETTTKQGGGAFSEPSVSKKKTTSACWVHGNPL